MNVRPSPLISRRAGQFLDTLVDGILVLVFLVILLSAPAFASSATYTYDVQGRLATATYSAGAVTTYSYDAAGNRTSVVTAGAPK